MAQCLRACPTFEGIKSQHGRQVAHNHLEPQELQSPLLAFSRHLPTCALAHMYMYMAESKVSQPSMAL